MFTPCTPPRLRAGSRVGHNRKPATTAQAIQVKGTLNMNPTLLLRKEELKICLK